MVPVLEFLVVVEMTHSFVYISSISVFISLEPIFRMKKIGSGSIKDGIYLDNIAN